MSQVFQGEARPEIISIKKLKALLKQITAFIESEIEIRKITFDQLLIDLGIYSDKSLTSPEGNAKERDSREPSFVFQGKATDPDEIFTETEAAKFLKIHVDSLRELRKESRGPNHTRHGRRFYYIRKELIAWHNKPSK